MFCTTVRHSTLLLKHTLWYELHSWQQINCNLTSYPQGKRSVDIQNQNHTTSSFTNIQSHSYKRQNKYLIFDILKTERGKKRFVWIIFFPHTKSNAYNRYSKDIYIMAEHNIKTIFWSFNFLVGFYVTLTQ